MYLEVSTYVVFSCELDWRSRGGTKIHSDDDGWMIDGVWSFFVGDLLWEMALSGKTQGRYDRVERVGSLTRDCIP